MQAGDQLPWSSCEARLLFEFPATRMLGACVILLDSTSWQFEGKITNCVAGELKPRSRIL
jgi:hypothetical protein